MRFDLLAVFTLFRIVCFYYFCCLSLPCAWSCVNAPQVLWLFGRTRTGKVANPDLAVRVVGTPVASRIGDSVQRAVEENVADLEVGYFTYSVAGIGLCTFTCRILVFAFCHWHFHVYVIVKIAPAGLAAWNLDYTVPDRLLVDFGTQDGHRSARGVAVRYLRG